MKRARLLHGMLLWTAFGSVLTCGVAASAAEAIKLSVMLDHTVQAPNEAIMKAYHALHPDVDFDIQVAPPDQQQLVQKMMLQYAAGNPIDLVIDDFLEPWITPQMELDGLFVNLDPMLQLETGLKDRFVEGALSMPRNPIDHHLYALPIALLPDFGVVYNKRFVADAGFAMPREGWTLDEFEALAKAMTRATPDGNFSRMGYTQGDWSWFKWIFLAMGGRWYDEDTLELFPDEEIAVRALQFTVDLFARDQVGTPKGWGVFARSQAAMILQSPGIYALAGDPKYKFDLDNIGFIHAPVAGPNVTPTIPYSFAAVRIGASKDPRRVQAAWDFAKFRVEAANQLRVTQMDPRLLPTTKQGLQSVARLDFTGKAAIMYAVDHMIKQPNVLRAPALFWSPGFYDDYRSITAAAFAQKLNPKEAVAKIKAKMAVLNNEAAGTKP